MKKSPFVMRSLVLCLLLLSGLVLRVQAQGTAFTYQGTLSANGAPVTGTNDLTFTLYDASTAGAAVGTSNEVLGLVITNGLFTLTLDFGNSVFNGSSRWLEIGVRPGGGVGDYTALAPRQLITATPYAQTAGNLTGPVPSGGLTGTYPNPVVLNNSANVIAGTFSGDGAALAGLNAANMTSGRLVDARLSTNVALLNGRQTFTSTNVFTTTNANSPITITNAADTLVAMDFRQRYYRWRVGQNRPPDSPTSADSFFIIGDDLSLSPRTRFLIDSAGRVGIGTTAPSSRLHVAGGITADSDLAAQRLLVGESNVLAGIDSSIAGGRFNTLPASADASAIGGGEGNTILTNAHHSAIGGGQSNTVLGFYATIPGGLQNQATNYAFAAGRRAQANHPGAFVWADSQDADFTSTDTNQFSVRAGGGVRFVTGGGGLTVDGQNVLIGVVPSSGLSGNYSNAVTFSNAANAFVGRFVGNGAGLTNLSVSGGTNGAQLNANQTFSGANTFTNTANSFVGSHTGNGAGLTNLSAANLASGTVPGARLSGIYSNALTLNNSGNTFVGGFTGNGAGLTNLIVASTPTNVALLNSNQTFAGANLFTNLANTFFGGFTGDGAGLTNLNVPGASTNSAMLNASQTFTGANTFTNAANSFAGVFTGNGAGLTNLNVAIGGTNGALLNGNQTFVGVNIFTNAGNSFVGTGAGLTGLNASNLATGIVPSARLSGTYSGALTLNNAANRFTGNGAGLTTLNASNLSSGTIADARLSTNVPLINASQTFAGINTFSNSANTFVGGFTGDGAGLTNLNPGSLSTNVALLDATQTFVGTNTFTSPANTFAGSFAGDGAGLTNLNVPSVPAGVALLNTNQTFTGANTFTNTANVFVGTLAGNGGGVTNLNASNLASGNLPGARLSGVYSNALTLNNAANTFAGSFSGNGAGLTNLNVPSVPAGVALLNTNQTFAGVNTFTNPANAFAGSFTGNGSALTSLNASNLASGIVPSARLSGTYSGALTLNNAANRFTGNGSGLTTLNASNLSSGTVADARLSTNVALLAASQTFPGVNTFTNAANTFVGGFTGDGAGLTNLNAGNLSSNVALLNTTQTFSGTNVFSSPANMFAGSFSGDGAGLTNLNVPSLPVGVALLNTNQTFSGANNFSNAANTFVGSHTGGGAGLTNLNAGSLSSGTLPGARLSGSYSNALAMNNAANSFAGSFSGNGAGLTNLNVPSVPAGVALLNTNQTFSGLNTFSNAANVFVGTHTGDASGLTNLNAANLSSGTVPSAQLSGTYGGALTMNNPANRFTGNGAGLTSLNASNLVNGTVADARLSTNVAFLAGSQTFVGTNTFTNAANTFAGSFTGNGAGLTNLNVPSLPAGVALLNTNQTFSGVNTFSNAANVFVGSHAGDASGLTNVNAASLSSGTVPGARLSGTYANALTLNNAANTFAGSFTGNGAGLTNLNVPSVPAGVALLNTNQTFTGANSFANPANSFVGSLNGNGAGVTNLNAANLSSGTIPSAQLSGVYSGALTLNNAANRFTGNGAALTALNASNLGSGTVADARLSTNVALLAASQSFTGTNLFTNAANAFSGSFTGNLLRTPDNTPLELRVNGALALRLEPTAGGFPNVIGGSSNSVVSPGTVGAAIGGGISNVVGGQTSVVGGGAGNTANGLYATIPGGSRNVATNYAFAAGRRAQAVHEGALVWGDATDADLASTNANSVTFRAGGGYRLFSSTNASAGVSLATDGTSWGSISDRNAKKNFQSVDVRAMLEKLALVPVQQWNYKWESDAEVPHLGPMAQDFKHAFYPGRDDKVITTQEIDGVALAAIQGMNQKVEEQAEALRSRDAELQELRQAVAELKDLVNALTQKAGGSSR